MPDIRIVPSTSILSFTSSLNYIEKITQDPSGSLVLYGSGSVNRTSIFAIDGNNGRLLEITDDLSDSIFSANTIAGIPVIEAFSDYSVRLGTYNGSSGSTVNISGSCLSINTASPNSTAAFQVNALDKKLIYTTSAPTNYTFTTGVPTGVTGQTWPASYVQEGELVYNNVGGSNGPSIFNNRYWVRNTNTNNSTVYLYENYLHGTWESTGVGGLWGFYIQVGRGYQTDTNTNTVSNVYGTFTRSGHTAVISQNSTTSAIVTNNVIGTYTEAQNYSGTVNNAYSLYVSNIVGASNARNSTTTTQYGIYIRTAVGGGGSGVGTLTTLYTLYMDTPVVSGGGTLTTRWGIYAPDTAMNHFIAGKVGINTTSLTTALTVNGTITELSSIRYKENIETIPYSLDKVTNMRGVTYIRKETGVKEVGVIAEEVEQIFPDLVTKNQEGQIESVSYGRFTALLIEAVKEQQVQIDQLKLEINNLKNK